MLRDRLDEMTLGERVALARVGSREIVQALRRVREEPVFQALLTNPRLTEEDLVPIATDPQTPAPILSSIVRHARWNNRYNLRLAVVRNPTTPPAVALSQLITLSEKDLRDLGRHQSVTSAVRSAAVQVLERRSSG